MSKIEVVKNDVRGHFEPRLKAAQYCERFLCDMNDDLVGKLTKTLSKAKKKKN